MVVVWRDEELASTEPIAKLPTWHRFEDADVVFWRTDWGAKATAVAFKCGPPEGHETTELMQKYPDWHLEDGHVHPDVNSFILFAKGAVFDGGFGVCGDAEDGGAQHAAGGWPWPGSGGNARCLGRDSLCAVEYGAAGECEGGCEGV